MGFSYRSFRYVLSLLLICYFHNTSSLALAVSQGRGDNSLVSPNLNLNAPPAGPLGNMMDNLLHSIWTRPEVGYRQATLHIVAMRLADNDPPTHSSSLIHNFRSIQTVFRFKPELPPPLPDCFFVNNRYPEHWQQWGDRVLLKGFPGSTVYHALQWPQIWARMSVERADMLLKGMGYRGSYHAVFLVHLRSRPSGWCFENVETGSGERVSVNVEVYSAKVLVVERCTGDAPVVNKWSS